MNATRRRMSWMHRAPVRGLLLTLTLLFAPWSGVPAAEDTEQEIGRPVPMPTTEALTFDEMVCSSGVLLPNKDGFYTVRDGLLSEYQIKPFKRVRSVRLEWDAYNKASGSSSGVRICQIWTTDDQSKVIIYNSKKLLLFDANNGRLLNSSPLPDDTVVFNAQIDGDEILLLVEPEASNRNEGWRGKDCYQLLVWDLNTLRQKKSIRLGEHAGFYRDMTIGPIMSIADGRIYLLSRGHDDSHDIFIVLNRKTYAPELRVTLDVKSSVVIYPDLNRLRIYNVIEMVDYLSRDNPPNGIYKESSLVFDQMTRKIELTRNNKRPAFAELRMEGVKLLFGYRNLSRNHHNRMSGSYTLDIFPDMTYMRYVFYQYEDGEAIMMNCKSVTSPADKCEWFEMTPGARKYMQMKVNEGAHVPRNEIKTLPINDATFDKYYIKGVKD